MGLGDATGYCDNVSCLRLNDSSRPGSLAMEGQPEGQTKFDVVACIAGRGFGVRREDMKKLLLATRGKVFTLQNMDRLVECTRAGEFKTR